MKLLGSAGSLRGSSLAATSVAGWRPCGLLVRSARRSENLNEVRWKFPQFRLNSPLSQRREIVRGQESHGSPAGFGLRISVEAYIVESDSVTKRSLLDEWS